MPAEFVVPRPQNLSWAQSANLLLVGGAAAHTLIAAGVSDGDTVLVHGAAGGVGSIVVQLAVARGARVIGTASPDGHDLVRSLGGEAVTYGEGLAERVRALAPRGVNAAIDTVGSDEAVDVSLELVPDKSRIASIAAFKRKDTGIKILGAGGVYPGGTTSARRPASTSSGWRMWGSFRSSSRRRTPWPMSRKPTAT